MTGACGPVGSAARALAAALVVVSTLSAAGLAPVGTAAAAPTTVGGCTTIGSGGVYELDGDVTNATTTCIVIAADDVVLDGDGNTVDGNLTDDTAGIRVDRGASNVTVRDLTVRQFANGTVVEGAGRVTLTDVRVAANGEYGVVVAGSSDVTVDGAATNVTGNGAGLPGEFGGFAGVLVRDSTGVTVSDGRVVGNFLYGIEADGNTDLTVTDVTLTGHTGDAIRLVGTTSFEVREVNVTGNGADGAGIATEGSATGVIRDSDIVDNEYSGISIESDDVRVLNTDVSNNGAPRFAGGIRIRSADNVTLRDLRVANNSQFDVRLTSVTDLAAEDVDLGSSTAPNTTVSFTGTNVNVLGVDAPPASPAGETGIGRYINVTSPEFLPTGFLEFTLEYEDRDAGAVDESELDVWAYNATTGAWTEVGGTVDTAANEVSYNATSPGVFAPLGPAEVDLTGDGNVSRSGDGSYAATPEHEDVTGDGRVTTADVVALFRNLGRADGYPALFDFTGDGRVTTADVVALFNRL